MARDEKILEHLPDIIILDMTMPGKAGLDSRHKWENAFDSLASRFISKRSGPQALPALPTKKSDAQANCNLGARCKEKQPPPGTARL